MSEQYSTHPEITDIQAVERIGREALVIVDHLYGSGDPDWSQGETPLSYHNGHHGRSVGNDGMRVASHYGLDPLALAITGAAGHAHDLIQLKGRGVDESESAQWLDLKLIERGITDPGKRANAYRRQPANLLHPPEETAKNPARRHAPEESRPPQHTRTDATPLPVTQPVLS